MNKSALGNFTDSRNNNLTAIRLIAALMVLFYHSFSLMLLPDIQVLFIQKTQWGTMGVFIFLLISGFLITKSVENNNSIKYFWSRILRIFPALIVLVLATIFILGPLVTKFTLGEYYSNPETWSYFKTLSLYVIPIHLPGVFTNNLNSMVNGPLWTLSYLFTFYLVVFVLAASKILRNKELILGLFILSFVLCIFKASSSINTLNITFSNYITLFTYFSFGMVLYLHRDQIPIRLDIFLFVIILLIIASAYHGFSITLAVFPVGYLIMFLAYSPSVNLRWLTKWGDFSYGFYIWAWPIQQTILNYFGKMNPWLLFLSSGIITYCIAALSWHLIEKRMLKLKSLRIVKTALA